MFMRGQKYLFYPIFSLLLTAFFTIFSTTARSQNLKFGLKGSPSIVWMKPDYQGWEASGLRTGFGFGLVTDFGLSDHYFISTGVEIAHRGGNLSQRIDSIAYHYKEDFKYKLQYLDIPVTLKLKTNKIGYFSYFGQFGVTGQILLKARADRSGGTLNNLPLPVLKDVNYSSMIIPVGMDMTIGAGIEYEFAGSTALLAGLTFHNGFTDLLKNSTGNTGELRYRATCNTVVLNIGILF